MKIQKNDFKVTDYKSVNSMHNRKYVGYDLNVTDTMANEVVQQELSILIKLVATIVVVCTHNKTWCSTTTLALLFFGLRQGYTPPPPTPPFQIMDLPLLNNVQFES